MKERKSEVKFLAPIYKLTSQAWLCVTMPSLLNEDRWFIAIYWPASLSGELQVLSDTPPPQKKKEGGGGEYKTQSRSQSSTDLYLHIESLHILREPYTERHRLRHKL